MAVAGGSRSEAATEPSLRQVLDGIDPKLRSVLLPFAIRHPRRFWAYGKLIRGYERARKARKANRDIGLTVPPFMIVSITSHCNLRCVGCYAAAAHIVPSAGDAPARSRTHNLPFEQWQSMIAQACELGTYGFIIAGGEPFLYPHLLDLCQEFDDRVFIIVTNGTAISSEHYERLRSISNVCIVISIEGPQDVTDERRGPGVYEKAMATIERLGQMGIISGISVTVTAANYAYWMDEAHIDELVERGVMLGVFIEYIPTDDGRSLGPCGSVPVMLTSDERSSFRSRMLTYRDKKPIYIVHSPGDEELFGGCVSAGRGFAHITPEGDLTPCPVSNVATHNLTVSSLRDGLSSPLFAQIRESGTMLETKDGPCALFSHPQEVDELARRVGAYRAGERGGAIPSIKKEKKAHPV